MSGQIAVAPYAHRKINVTFDMTSNFSAGSYNSSKITGLRASATLNMLSGSMQASLQLRVWGLTLSRMNDLTQVSWLVNSNRGNKVTVEAGDDVNGMWQVFAGDIYIAFMDGANQPEVSFYVESIAGYAELLRPGPPISMDGQTDVAQQMEKLATAMGYGFKNAGVTAQLNQSYIPNTLMVQAQTLAEHANIDMHLNPATGVMEIRPKGQPIDPDGQVPLVSADTGMHDYPVINQNFLAVTTTWNPALKMGGLFQLKSQIEPANGNYLIQQLTHTLEAEIPGGKWTSSIQATKQN